MSTPADLADLWAAFPPETSVDPGEPVWEDPVPLSRKRALPAFPTGTFPGWLREFCDAVAEETQTPVDLAGTVALSVLATAAGGRATVHIRGNWREPLNLYTVCALPPANRKSAVFTALTDPLYEAEKQLQATMGPAIVEAEMTARLAKSAADKAADRAASAPPDERDGAVAEAISLAQTAEAITVPAKPQLIADDSTAETVTSLMDEQGGRISVMSAEGGIFDIIAGRYSGAPNMEPFLKGHAGDRMRVNRQTRKEYIDHPALTMGLSVQPEVLQDIGRVKGFDGRGFLARFLYSVPASLVGYREVETEPVPEPVAARYAQAVQTLTLGLAEWTDPAVLQLSPDADAVLLAFQKELEPQLAERGGALGHIVKWAGKLAGAIVRMAGLLHLADHPTDGHTVPVTAATMNAAIELGRYFTAHALATFDAMGADPTTARARTILETLRTHRLTDVSKRDLFSKLSRSEFATMADLDTPLDLLADHGFIRPKPVVRAGGRGRPPSPRFLTHPTLTHT